MLAEQVKKTIRRHRLAAPGERILVAVSGGPDSTALLQLLYELRAELELGLEVAHLEHGLRGKESAADAAFVEGLARRLELPFHLGSVDLPELKSRAGKGNVEALARAERYRFFAEVARRRNLAAVATAHTLDDQAETVLMRFLRGAGLRGLGGMAPVRILDRSAAGEGAPLKVIRPLLEVAKADILRYLQARGLAYRKDATNEDPTLLRNWLRLHLIPELQTRFGLDLPSRLCRQAEIARDEERLISALARKRLEEIRIDDRLDRKLFLAQAPALQRAVVRCWIEEKRGHLRGLGYDHVEAALAVIGGERPQGRSAIPGGWEVVREYEALALERSAGRRQACYAYEIEIGKSLAVPEAGVVIESELLRETPEAFPEDLEAAVFDAALLPDRLWVRNYRRGDRFQPLGMSGHKKLKDLFMEKKVPLSARATMPVLVSADEILWIPGCGRSDRARITRNTVEIARFSARPVAHGNR
ncbi:MAG TPA: tRNA lysidine(34) synthetase TilS [candidate division Zixibacteria bacterium]|nr:tRNA lysidine(34) synthetase TilS [candidate division Zixibacteria bacterium]